jgi:DNA repair protein RadD
MILVMILRPRQIEFVNKSVAALKEHGNTVSVAFTGAGKTICLSAVIKHAFEQGLIRKALVIAHRDEITYQNQDKFSRVAPNISTSLFNGDCKDWSGQTVFGMVQSLSRENALEELPKFDLVVIDEAHHVTAETYRKVIDCVTKNNPNARIFGVTATPMRGDKNNIGVIFSNCADQISLPELIGSGHLVPPVTYRIDTGETGKKLEAVSLRKGSDYNDKEIADILDTVPLNTRVVEEWRAKAGDRKTVVFCSDIKHATNVTNAFKRSGIKAELVTSLMSSEARHQVLQDIETGKVQVLVNVAILTEGWDYPPISCVVILRCSSYKSTMIQMIGRGLRPIDASLYPNIEKEDCIVLDFGISTILHGSLEQDLNLKSEDNRKEDNACPDCSKKIPASAEVCPLCNVDIEEAEEKQKVAREKRILERFVMAEINLLEKSHFTWTDLRLPNKARMAAGFNVWCCVLEYAGKWIAIGGSKSRTEPLVDTTILHKGNKLQALAAGNDFMNMHETNDTATKFARWRHEKPTDKQRKWLPSQFKRVRKITKGDAGAILTYQMQAQVEINNALSYIFT